MEFKSSSTFSHDFSVPKHRDRKGRQTDDDLVQSGLHSPKKHRVPRRNASHLSTRHTNLHDEADEQSDDPLMLRGSSPNIPSKRSPSVQLQSTPPKNKKVLTSRKRPIKQSGTQPASAIEIDTPEKNPSRTSRSGPSNSPSRTKHQRVASGVKPFPLAVSPLNEPNSVSASFPLDGTSKGAKCQPAPFPMTVSGFKRASLSPERRSPHNSSQTSFRTPQEEHSSDGDNAATNSSAPSSDGSLHSDLVGSGSQGWKRNLKRAERTGQGTSGRKTPILNTDTTPVRTPPPTLSMLCPFCDEPLPINPSTRLRNLLAHLVGQSWHAARPSNPRGRDAPLQVSINLCSAHRAESRIIPDGISRGWPTRIDFGKIANRMGRARFRSHLEQIFQSDVTAKRGMFWEAACRDVEARGARVANSMQGQMETFEMTQPGYYGEQGQLAIAAALNDMFPLHTIPPSAIAPLQPQDFLRRVLLPETAVLLIMEDLGEDRASALKILQESRAFGLAAHPAKEGDDSIMDISMVSASPHKRDGEKGKGKGKAKPPNDLAALAQSLHDDEQHPVVIERHQPRKQSFDLDPTDDEIVSSDGEAAILANRHRVVQKTSMGGQARTKQSHQSSAQRRQEPSIPIPPRESTVRRRLVGSHSRSKQDPLANPDGLAGILQPVALGRSTSKISTGAKSGNTMGANSEIRLDPVIPPQRTTSQGPTKRTTYLQGVAEQLGPEAVRQLGRAKKAKTGSPPWREPAKSIPPAQQNQNRPRPPAFTMPTINVSSLDDA